MGVFIYLKLQIWEERIPPHLKMFVGDAFAKFAPKGITRHYCKLKATLLHARTHRSTLGITTLCATLLQPPVRYFKPPTTLPLPPDIQPTHI
jgi:hypothetical protein